MTRSAKALILAGILLIASSLGILLSDRLLAKKAEKDASAILEQLDSMLPQRTAGVPDSYRALQMPALQIKEQDIIAILEIPAYGVRLPVCSSWEQGRGIPRRFSGSTYDRSLIIGGTDHPEQFQCFDRIDQGETVMVTDMTGAEFTYTVAEIRRSASADSEVLLDENFDLTLFTRDAYTMDYLLVRCLAGKG